MKSLMGTLGIVAVVLLSASGVFANGLHYRTGPVSKTFITAYNTKNKCRVICRGSKPFMEYVEDGLAYALDLPLAILSPITCPIVSPFLDRFDSDGGRTYSRR